MFKKKCSLKILINNLRKCKEFTQAKAKIVLIMIMLMIMFYSAHIDVVNVKFLLRFQ